MSYEKNYEITPADLAAITNFELAYGTDRFLPKQVPANFDATNYPLYFFVAEELMNGRQPKGLFLTMHKGFESSLTGLNRCVQAHLKSKTQSREELIAGVAYMLCKICDIAET